MLSMCPSGVCAELGALLGQVASGRLRGGQFGGFLAGHLDQQRAAFGQPGFDLGGQFGVVPLPLRFPLGVLLQAEDRLAAGRRSWKRWNTCPSSLRSAASAAFSAASSAVVSAAGFFDRLRFFLGLPGLAHAHPRRPRPSLPPGFRLGDSVGELLERFHGAG